MLKIRLQRVGKRNHPAFRMVLTESKNSTKSGKFLEILGNHNPITKHTEIDAERVKHWIKNGVQLTGTVNNLLINKGVIKGEKVDKNPKKTVAKKEEEKVEAKPEVKPEVKEEVAAETKEEVKPEAPAETATA